MRVKRWALRGSLLMVLCAGLVPVLATGSASALTSGFDIYNLTGKTLKLSQLEVSGNQPVFEGLKLREGKILAPGEKVHVELFRGLNGSENRKLTAEFTPLTQDQPGIQRFFKMTIDSNRGAATCFAPRYSQSSQQCEVGSGRIKMLDAAGTVHNLYPQENGDAPEAAAVMANLCRSDSGATCDYDPVEDPGPDTHAHAGAEVASAIVTNCSTDEHNDVDHTFKFDHKTGSENSIEAGFEYEYDSNFLVEDAKIKIHAAYGHKWDDEVTVSDETVAHIPGGHTSYVSVTAPVIRYTGDYTVTMANTEWRLHHVTWDVPDPNRKTGKEGSWYVVNRKATADELKKCDEAVKNPDGTVIQSSPHSVTITKRGTNAHNVLRGGPESNVLIGRGGNDVLVGGGGSNRLVGGAGNDALLADSTNGTDILNGGPGADTMIARGAAIIRTGKRTGRGWDYVYVRDGRPDQRVFCQTRRTIVYADKGDQVRGHCGKVIRTGPINQPRPLM
jgi:hypothetical protein